MVIIRRWLALAACGVFVLSGEALKNLSGICIGLGAGLFGLAAANLWMHQDQQKNPEVWQQATIEEMDERSIMIRNRAKAKSADFIQWAIIAVAFGTILTNQPLWLTLLLVGLFIIKTILELYWMQRYQREL